MSLPPGGIALVFESGVLRFDEDGALHVHLTHGPDAPHPVQIHPAGGGGEARGLTAPSACRAVELTGASDVGAVHGGFTDTDALPDGLVISIRGYTRVRLEASGDLTVELEGVDGLPDWFVPGQVHRFDGPDDGVRLWSGSAAPPVRRPTPRPRPAETGSPPPRQAATGGGGCVLLLLAAGLAPLVAHWLSGLA